MHKIGHNHAFKCTYHVRLILADKNKNNINIHIHKLQGRSMHFVMLEEVHAAHTLLQFVHIDVCMET